MRTRMTMAAALVRFLSAQRVLVDDHTEPLFGGLFAIFGHGNVAGIGQALTECSLPTFRAHNEQAMGHAAVAFAKTHRRRRMMACTTSIGPGATNLVTAAATAHVNRLPVLFLPGDIFANRAPDPVLQQVEDFGDPNITANDCLRPVSRYFDRIVRPEQILSALPRAIQVLTDPAECGPVTLALPQDVQTEAHDYPDAFFEPVTHRLRRAPPDEPALFEAVSLLARAKQPLIIAGGGVHYSGACERLAAFAREHGVPVAETQAGKGALAWDHPRAVGAIGVTGSSAANELAAEADVVLAVGTRLSDFTTASRTLFQHPDLQQINLNVTSFDAHKHGAFALIADARVGLEQLSKALGSWRAEPLWIERADTARLDWEETITSVTTPVPDTTPTDAQVLGAVNQCAGSNGIVVCASGGLPGELHKLWRAHPGSYHLEYGYSCMGYEIAGGLGVKMAAPDREVFVMVGDGSYLMLNSEIATSVMMGAKLIIVVLDNHGFGCISRLQQATGGAPFNNLLSAEAPRIDFAQHARALGAEAREVLDIAELSQALDEAVEQERTTVLVIETEPRASTKEGGAWWDVAVPETSEREETRRAREQYTERKKKQRGA